MTKRDAIKAAISHKEVGVVPYWVDFNPEPLERAKVHFPNGDLGNFLYGISPPWWDWYQLPESYNDFDAPDFLPQTRGRGSYEIFRDELQFAKEKTDCYRLAWVYGTHFEKANFARGIENFLADLAGNKEFAKSLLDMIIRKNIVMLENILTYPEIDGVLLGSDWGSQQSLLMNPDTWRELIAPGELKEYELIKNAGKDVWIHSCGNIEQILPDLIDMGVDVINPVQSEAMNIYDLKIKYGSKITFCGGISTQQTLPYGTPEEVKAETEKVVSFMSKGGGYIAGPSQCIQDDVPTENILVLLEKLKSFT